MKKRFWIGLFNLWCLFFIFCSFGWSDNGQAKKKIIYNISPLGVSEYQDLGLTNLDGKEVNLTVFKTRMMGFVDKERIYSDPKSMLPIRVERDITLWAVKEYIVEEYNPQNYTLVIRKIKNNKVVEEHKFKEAGPIYNGVTLPFFLKNIAEFTPGWTMDIRLPEKFSVKLVDIENVKVPAGTFRAYHFTSIPHKFEIWISDDEAKIPLKIKGVGLYGYTLSMKKNK